MWTQGEHNAEVRLSISCPSAEKTDSPIHRLKNRPYQSIIDFTERDTSYLFHQHLKIQKIAKTHGNTERMFSTNSIRKNPMVILDFWYLDLGFQDPDPLISVVGLDRPGSGNPKPIWILAYRRFCIFSNFQISHLKISMWVRVLHKIITYYKKTIQFELYRMTPSFKSVFT